MYINITCSAPSHKSPEEKRLICKEPLAERVHTVYGTLSLTLPPKAADLISVEKGSIVEGRLHGDNCKRIYKDIGKGTYIGRFEKGICVFGKRVYCLISLGNENGSNSIEEEGSFDDEGLLHGPNCRQVSLDASPEKGVPPRKLWEHTGTFEHGEMKEGVQKAYCFYDGVHIKEGAFKGGFLDGENCKKISPYESEVGRFKEGRLIFGVKVTQSESKQQNTIKEEGSFDLKTGKLHGKNCTISTAKWSLTGEAIQGIIENGRLTIHTENKLLHEADKEALRNIGFLGFPQLPWWQRLSL